MSQRIKRLEFDQLRPDLAKSLEPRVKRLGYLGEFFKCTAHVPEALLKYMEFTEALKEPLAPRLTEVVALTVACATGNDYERHQHGRLSVKLDFGKNWVSEVEKLRPGDADLMSEEEKATQLYTISALKHYGKQTKKEWEDLVTVVGPTQAIAVLLLVGRYATHTLVVNTLELEPPVPSVFDESQSQGGN